MWQTDWRKGWYGEGHILGFPRGFSAMRAGVVGALSAGAAGAAGAVDTAAASVALSLREVPATGAPSGSVAPAGCVLENEYYQVCFDGAGRVTGVLDRETGRRLLDARAPWGFAEVIHESIAGAQDREAVWERGIPLILYGKRHIDATFQCEGSLAAGQVVCRQCGPVFASFTRRASLPFAPVVDTEVRLWRGVKRIDVEVRVAKQPHEAYESLYVAVPFEMAAPRALIHSGGALFEAEREQLPGTCRDFYALVGH